MLNTYRKLSQKVKGSSLLSNNASKSSKICMHATCACILKRNKNISSHLTAMAVNIKLNANINWTDITK